MSLGAQGTEWECDPKRVRALVREYGKEGRKGKDPPPLIEEGPSKPMRGHRLDAEQASKARR